MSKSSNSSKPDADLPTGFSDREIGLILKSLPADTGSQLRRRLESQLREWSQTNVPAYLLLDKSHRPLTTVQRRQAAAVERSAAALWKAIDGLDLRARDAIVLNLARPLATLATPVSTQPEALAAARHQLDETRDYAEKICLATERASSRSHRGRPMKLAPFLILNDLAGMFEDATGTKATRITVRDSDEYDGGPFFKFAAAVWPVVFDNGFAGLSAALRKWAELQDGWNRAD